MASVSSEYSSSGAMVPVTLDLTVHARLGLNGLLGSLDPEVDYDPFFLTFFLANPPYMLHWSSMYSGVLPKYLEAIPLLRLASGSEQGSEIERGMLDAVIQNTSHDGLIYDEEKPDRPWNCGIGYGVRSWHEDYANLAGNGRLIIGFYHYYALTGDPIWLDRLRLTGTRLVELAIHKDDYAYYPNVGLGNDFSYPKNSGWVHTNEPAHGIEGSEGATLFYQSQPIRGLIRWYRLSGDERALEVSRRLTNFIRQPRFWGGYNDLDPAVGAARGHFWGHYHGNTAVLRALLEYAIVANDWPIKQFVRDAYDYAHQHAVPQLGLFPHDNGRTEGCTIADMVALAIQLTDAGLGDYWDDVDHYVRNGLVECQTTDRSELERMADVSPEREKNARWGAATDWRFERGIQREALPGQECTDRVIERAIGGFSHLVGARYQIPFLMHCCTANGNQAIYYAWEAILGHHNGAIQVNLLLNRRSPWLDVESWLPYQGKTVLRNKTAKRVAVRIPGWVNRRMLRFQRNALAVEPAWTGNYVVFDDLKPEQDLTIEFPLQTETTTLVQSGLNGRGGRTGLDRWTCQFRGSTLIRLGESGEEPGGQQLDWYRIFRRRQYEIETAPMACADPYIAAKVIEW